MKRKVFVTVVSVFLLIGLLAGCSSSEEPVSVQSVAMITGMEGAGLYDRYAGVVEAGDTIKIQKDSSLEIAELNVEAGDFVTKGQTLFVYETETLALELEMQELELEQLQTTITTKKAQIQALEKEKAAAAESDKLQYTIQIQQLQLDVKEAEFNVTAKQKEIERSKATLADAKVTSPVNGRIKSIQKETYNDPGVAYKDDGSMDGTAFITITEDGAYRVKGTINEQNAYDMAEGLSVIIRSRTDATVTWTGIVTGIDWENPITNNNDYFYGETDEMTTSSKYPFYIELDTDDGLMLGQHVYIEPDLGQDEETPLALYAYYIMDADTEAWVWAANADGELEKRPVTLGTYDAGLDTYEILEGLTPEDYIAFPDDTLKEGLPVVYYDESSFDGGMIDEGMMDDGMVDEMLPMEDGIALDPESTEEPAEQDPGLLPAADDGEWPDDSVDPVTGTTTDDEGEVAG